MDQKWKYSCKLDPFIIQILLEDYQWCNEMQEDAISMFFKYNLTWKETSN